MLKEWIDDIRQDLDHYKTNCWKYHVSGNVVELSILPAYLKQKKTYRCSVIAVGQVLQALSYKIEQEHSSFHIQSFPNLENPEIVATIRTDQKGNFTSYYSPKYKLQDPFTVLSYLVEQYQLKIGKLEEFPDRARRNITIKNSRNWLIIYSTSNNPFTWLNVGYLKESFKKECLQVAVQNFAIIDLCSFSHHQSPKLQISETEYLQTLVGILPVSVPVR